MNVTLRPELPKHQPCVIFKGKVCVLRTYDPSILGEILFQSIGAQRNSVMYHHEMSPFAIFFLKISASQYSLLIQY